MTDNTYIDHPILAIYPTTLGFGYALFRELETVQESGIAIIRRRFLDQYLERIKLMIKAYKPTVMLLPIPRGFESSKLQRKRELMTAIKKLAKNNDIVVHSYTRKQIQSAFTQFHAINKEQIAQALDKWFPKLAKRCPVERPNYMPADYFQPVYDAASLVATYYSITIDLSKKLQLTTEIES
ncbi:MAG: hypothetical protein JWN78_1630 [Bacteroidota bacterium]|nr:hypothetical protein [Bacteroidota bacterium]